jgi:hypothetical protein
MGIQKGLAAIKAHQDEIERRKEAATKNKVDWLNIPDGKTYSIRFLQELDEGAAGYLEKNGVGFFATEHSNPDDFRKKALCTADEGACYGCEQKELAYKSGDNVRGAGWKAKSRLYINVLARDDKGEETVKVMSQPNGSKSVVAPMLLQQAIDEGTITDRWWKIKRTGQKSETSYLPMPGAPKDDVKLGEYEVFDLSACVREVPYEEQEAHYSVVAERPDTDEPVSNPKADTSEEW